MGAAMRKTDTPMQIMEPRSDHDRLIKPITDVRGLLKDTGVFFFLAAVFLLTFWQTAGYWSMDDLDMIVRESPTDQFISYCLRDGRYVLAIAARAFQAM